MSTTEASSAHALDAPGDFDYRPVSVAGVASAVFGVLSLLLFAAGRDSFESCLALCPAPLAGIVLGWRALSRIRSNPGQFAGKKAAIFGLAFSTLCLVGGLAFAGYVHATEVPKGYVRTSFRELRPDEVDLRSNRPVSPEVAALDGQKVFIKGYIRPDSVQYKNNNRQFLLVRDNNQCCFGDLNDVKYYDQVAVATTGNLTVDYVEGALYRIGGKLHVHANNAANGTRLPVFILEADHAE